MREKTFNKGRKEGLLGEVLGQEKVNTYFRFTANFERKEPKAELHRAEE